MAIRLMLTRRVALPLLYIFSLYAAGGYLGAFADHATELGLRIRNAAFAMPLVTVFGYLSTQFLIRRVLKINECHSMLEKMGVKREGLERAFLFRSNWLGRISLIASVVITVIYLFVEGLLAVNLQPLILFMNISAIPFWAALCFLLSHLFFITRFVVVNYLDKKRLDLFSLRELQPISDLVVYNMAICAGLLAFAPVFWLGKTIPMLDLYLLFAVFIGFALFLFVPVFSIHFTLSKQKKLAIERINFAIRQLMQDKKIDSDVAFISDPDNLRKLASLISTKQELHEASEWPIDLPQGLKGLGIALSIPLSWAAGSMVENLISTLAVFQG